MKSVAVLGAWVLVVFTLASSPGLSAKQNQRSEPPAQPVQQVGQTPAPAPVIAYSSFLDEVEQGSVHEAEFRGSEVRAKLDDGRMVSTFVPLGEQPVRRLLEKNVVVTAVSTEEEPTPIKTFVAWLPMLFYVLVTWLFVARPLRQISRRLDRLDRLRSPEAKALVSVAR